MPLKVLCATACKFQRAIFPTPESRPEQGDWEVGIAISNDPGSYNVECILDVEGKPVGNVWNYELLPYQGHFNISITPVE
jgi:hypothetical protein